MSVSGKTALNLALGPQRTNPHDLLFFKMEQKTMSSSNHPFFDHKHYSFSYVTALHFLIV